MTFRPGPLRAAAALAAGFVVARVVYRVLFSGAGGEGVVLLPLPAIRLPAPFSHVVMLGPVTLDGLWDAAASALPIALTILAFGVLSAVVDVHRALARLSRRGPLRGIARALTIAWATLPSLAEGARAVRFAQRLRGERGGARMLLPLLERTLERAGTLAAALELRGFAGRGLDGDCLAPVRAEDVEIGWGSGADSLRGMRLPASLTLETGTLTLLAGATGAGKTTLLRALSGLHTHADGGWIRGSLRVAGHDRAAVPPRDVAQRVGVVLQHPREAFLTERVRDEIGLALELRGVAPVIVAARVTEIADRVGVTELLDRPTRGLSAGQATLVAIAAAVVERPILLLVDEPLADLDADARRRIVRLLDALSHEAGMCVVVAEHRVQALTDVADTVLRIEDGVVSRVAQPASGDGSGAPKPPPLRLHAAALEDAEVVLRARDITVRHGDTVAVASADVDLRAGRIVALIGPNGAGKSSLLGALALPRRGMEVETTGRIALVPDASDDLFVSDTVVAECRRADRMAARRHPSRQRSDPNAGRATTQRPAVRGTAERFAGFLGLDPGGAEFTARLARHPRDLSAGERRCLALAIQLAGAPRALLVDEPTRGLDPAARELVRRALGGFAAAGGAVLVASHEPDVARQADAVLGMRGGVMSESVSATVGAVARGTMTQAEPPAPGIPRRNTGGVPAAASDLPELWAAGGSPPRRGSGARQDLRRAPARSRLWAPAGLAAANLVALGAFCWPLVATAVPAQAHAAVPVAALALVPLAALVVIATLDGSVRSAHMLALLGTLAAIGAAVRIAGTGVGGVEAVFILLILAGRAYGARFGMLLGMATIALSTVITGTIGPWTPFQMFACAWVGAVAGLLPGREPQRGGRPLPAGEIALLSAYGILASYAFGLLMNLWFWPFAVGSGTGISYDGSAPLPVNLASFLMYSLVTSTLTWDTLRAITTVLGLVVVGRPILAALRRAKPLASRAQPSAAPRKHAPALS
ncbi:ATP-binding cassette domain-containing protein [Microbacterium timonense]|uniref:ATP-binding cassette domain-containing protein n=1 Tax=Microbacterium timonense TaxID=2086576 RepID=UPI000D105305|nr:ATP-binding cassette domain-containing protein [Microbacterium timonense]